MKKILFILAGAVMLSSSCTRDLTRLNNDPKNPTDAKSFTFLTNAERRFSNVLASGSQNLNVFRLIVQYWGQTTYTEESNYDLATRGIYDNIWDVIYRDVLPDLEEAKKLIPRDVPDQDIQKNQLAIADILQVYAYYYLVTTYGNIPYSEALDHNKPFPKYDDARTVYNDLLARLDADIAALNTNAASFGNADIVYGGNVANWKKFANSLKLKMGMLLADSDAASAKTIVEAAVAAGVFTSSADNAMFQYLSSPPNTNPIWVDLVQSNRDDFVPASTIVDKMVGLNDPRTDDYFTLDPTGNYSGGVPGDGTVYGSVSAVSPTITTADFPGVFLDYAEVEFFLAEAVERGFNVGGTAQEHYDKAVTASIVGWGGTAAEAAAYLAQPEVDYATAPGTYKEKIGVQKWIHLYNRGWDSWIEWRRLDAPHLDPATNAVSGIPMRYPYPVKEQNVNRLNYEQAAAAIGGDEVEIKLFWDKF